MFTRWGRMTHVVRVLLSAWALLAFSGALDADDVIWRAATRPAAAPLVSLGRPEAGTDTIVRAQGAEMGGLTPTPPPPPPPPPGVGSPFPGGAPAGEEAYNCGVANQSTGGGGFFQRLCDNTRRCWDDVTGGIGGAFQPGPGRGMFQSDHAFDMFISPVTNPSYFEDPRSLTEFRPVFIWQSTPGDNFVFGGNSNFYVNLRGSVALTERISFTLNRFGLTSFNVENPVQGFGSDTSLSEIQFGPKFTIIRNDTSNTLGALGLVLEIPAGANETMQGTGNLSLRPYFSFGQNFLRSDYGSFNFLNTTGYAVSMDSKRTDFLFSSFHLSYDVGALKKFYPFIELNFIHYTMNGSARSVGFEGGNLFNAGSDGVAGQQELTIGGGLRYLVSQSLQFGLGAETSLLGGSRHLDTFRLTFDVIFRY